MQPGNTRRIYRLFIVFAVLSVMVIASCSAVLRHGAGQTLQMTDTPERCPEATAEPFYVDPVTSPTTQITQTLHISIGNGEAISVTNDMGSFYAPASAGKVIVVLTPNQINYLTAYGKVRQMGGECHYGGYTLSTRVDRNGNPLTVVQGSAGLIRYFLTRVGKNVSTRDINP